MKFITCGLIFKYAKMGVFRTDQEVITVDVELHPHRIASIFKKYIKSISMQKITFFTIFLS